MEDISRKISDLLGSPDGLDRLKTVAESLLGNNTAADEQAAPQEGGFSLAENLLENIGNMQGIMKVAGLLGKGQKDSRIDLLRALKPHLSNKKTIQKSLRKKFNKSYYH